MKIIAHRGDCKYKQENSMQAYFKAYFDGASGLETDVRMTKDNILVLCHDKTIDRISNKRGKITDYTYNELLKIDFNGEKIVTLEEFLKFFGNKNIILEIEIKQKNIENKVYELLKKYNIKNAVVISFKYEILLNMYKLDNNIKLGYLVHKIDNKIIIDAKRINCYQIIALSMFINEDDVIEVNKNNILLYAWGISSLKELKRLISFKINGIIVDSYIDVINYLN